MPRTPHAGEGHYICTFCHDYIKKGDAKGAMVNYQHPIYGNVKAHEKCKEAYAS